MTQPINRETAIALAKEAGMAGMLTDVVCSLEEIHRLCNLAVAHDQARRKQQFVGFMHAMNSSQQPENRSTEELNCPHCGGSGHVDDVAHSRKDAEPVDRLTGCACRWDSEDIRVRTCARHQGWLDVVEEWATTAKENQFVIDRLTSKRQETEPNTDGTDYVSDREFDALILELQSITEEARATDYHDALRKAALFLNLLKSKAHKYANDIVRLDAACTEQHAAYTSAHNRLNEADKLLQQALEALETRIFVGPAIAAIRTYLENKNA